MKRAHRRLHVLIWLVLAPLIAIVLWVALQHRPAEPINDTLPEAFAGEAE